MSNQGLKERVDEAQQFVVSNWATFRRAAAAAFLDHGRGALLFDLLQDHRRYLNADAEFTYLTATIAHELTDGLSAFALSGEVDAYDVERQIVFVFWDLALDEGMIRLLREWPNGEPRLCPDRKWAFAIRECPRCLANFKSVGDWGRCPRCDHQFLASDLEYESQGHTPVTPIAVER